jgi:hypothetical protein
MNGFDLLAWLLEHRPHVPVLTMTAYGTEETFAQLRTYGSSECFVKPVDIAKVIDHMADSLSQNIRGHVQNLSLASFLQLIEMEKKTCTLYVEHEGQHGTLFIRKGTLIDAELADRGGESAATAILAWTGASIRISGNCVRQQTVIDKPFSFLVMEAMRLQDESSRLEAASAGEEPAPAHNSETDFGSLNSERAQASASAAPPAFKEEAPSALFAEEAPSMQVAEGGLSIVFMDELPSRPMPDDGSLSVLGNLSDLERRVPVPSCALAFAVVDMHTGIVLARGDRYGGVQLSELALTAAEILRHEGALLEEGNIDSVQELVLSSKLHCELIRPLPEVPGVFALLIFSPEDTNLVMARLELDAAISVLDWLQRSPAS